MGTESVNVFPLGSNDLEDKVSSGMCRNLKIENMKISSPHQGILFVRNTSSFISFFSLFFYLFFLNGQA